MVVETVEKRPGAKSLRRFRGDASKVQVRGPGLKKARTNQLQSFTIDVKDAGKEKLHDANQKRVHIYLFVRVYFLELPQLHFLILTIIKKRVFFLLKAIMQ